MREIITGDIVEAWFSTKVPGYVLGELELKVPNARKMFSEVFGWVKTRSAGSNYLERTRQLVGGTKCRGGAHSTGKEMRGGRFTNGSKSWGQRLSMVGNFLERRGISGIQEIGALIGIRWKGIREVGD